MNKPEKKYPLEPMYNYHEVIKYIEEKYSINTRDYANKFTKGGNRENEYLDFWHWIAEGSDISNGSASGVYVDESLEEAPDWVCEILKFITDEGFVDDEGYFEFWVEW